MPYFTWHFFQRGAILLPPSHLFSTSFLYYVYTFGALHCVFSNTFVSKYINPLLKYMYLRLTYPQSQQILSQLQKPSSHLSTNSSHDLLLLLKSKLFKNHTKQLNLLYNFVKHQGGILVILSYFLHENWGDKIEKNQKNINLIEITQI